MTPSAENSAARKLAPLASRTPKIPRRLLVITAAPGQADYGPTARKSAPTPQLRDAMTAAVSAARRVRNTSPIR